MISNRPAMLLAATVACGTLVSAASARAEFEIIDGWDKQLFPSYLVAAATMRPPEAPEEEDPAAEEGEEPTEESTDESAEEMQEEVSDEEAETVDESGESEPSDEEAPAEWDEEDSVYVIGNEAGKLGVYVTAPAEETYVTVEIEAPGILETSRWAGTLDEEGAEYAIYPPLKFNYRALIANKQAIPLAVTYRVTVGEEETEEETVTLTLRSINDCPFAVIWNEQDGMDVSFMFAAYVNEQHPFVDKILREALDRGIVDSFTGYQSGDPAMVYKQVYAVWDALSQRDVRYSNITATAADNQIVRSQHVRLIDESINNAQANCVDGSVLLASLLRKIDIQPALVLVPGHCYIAFSLDPEGKEWVGLETTLLGTTLGQAPPVVELDQLVETKWTKERSWGTFRTAVQAGGSDLEAKRENFANPNDHSHRVISIAAARRMGILPIAFDASEKFLSSPARNP
jgi:hypothetical protein